MQVSSYLVGYFFFVYFSSLRVVVELWMLRTLQIGQFGVGDEDCAPSSHDCVPAFCGVCNPQFSFCVLAN